jgi:hypothetical protein
VSVFSDEKLAGKGDEDGVAFEEVKSVPNP